MATQKTKELIEKNREDIIQQEQNILQAQRKLKKLKARRKELIEKENKENQKEMLDQLKNLKISDPEKLQNILNQYYNEQVLENEKFVKQENDKTNISNENFKNTSFD